MKKFQLILISLTLFLFLTSLKAAESNSLAERLKGRILLQTESYGRAWYIDPADSLRYYLRDGSEAYNIMRSLGLGITNQDLAKIPKQKGQSSDDKLVNRVKGRILLQVEERGEAWYVNPVDGLRHYLKDGQAAYELMRQFALGITNANLREIPMNQVQLTFDAAWDGVAYVALAGNEYLTGSNAERILPLASLSKLMTALVFYDTNPDWEKTITITQTEINYPKTLVGDDATSEIDLEVGDRLKIKDVWVALLLASSNQAAAVLADNSGLSQAEFVQRMNDKAKELGLVKTFFYEVAGLDANNISTPKEFAKLAQAAFNNTKIVEASSKTSYAISATDQNLEPKTINVANRNYSLLTFQPEASKTGFLVEAQRNVALKKNGKIIVVLHARSMKERNEIIQNFLD